MRKINLVITLFLGLFLFTGCDLIPEDVIDEYAPELSGTENISIPYGTVFDVLEGVSLAEEYSDSTITYVVKDSDGEIVVFDTSVPMDYYVTYTVTSSDQSQSITETRKVTVLEEETNELPVLTGDFSDIEIFRSSFDSYDYFANIGASDTTDGDLTKSIVVTLEIDGTVVSDVPSDYIGEVKVTYCVTDSDEESVCEEMLITERVIQSLRMIILSSLG